MTATRFQTPACMDWPVPGRRVTDLPDTTARIYAWQKGRCGICGTDQRRLKEDHSHETSLIRGLLCPACNTLEPHSEMRAFVAWRNGWNPATLLGVNEQYLSPFTGRPVLSPEAEWDLLTPEEQAAFDAELRQAVEGL